MNQRVCIPLFVLLALGCGRDSSPGPSYGGEDGKQIAIRVDALIDDRSDIRRMTKHFATGSAPDTQQWKKFAPYAFEVVGDPVINGTTATATIRIVFDSDRQEK